jgi:hypothetical protein
VTKRKEQRLGGNSVDRHAGAFQAASMDVPLPMGLVLRSEEEEEIWRAFTRARAREDWRDMDLILLHKVVRIEAEIRKLQVTLDAEGYRVENGRGTMVENALVRVLDTLTRQQLAVIRSMSLNSTGSDPRTINAQAKTESDYRKVIEGGGVQSLLAMPVN